MNSALPVSIGVGLKILNRRNRNEKDYCRCVKPYNSRGTGAGNSIRGFQEFWLLRWICMLQRIRVLPRSSQVTVWGRGFTPRLLTPSCSTLIHDGECAIWAGEGRHQTPRRDTCRHAMFRRGRAGLVVDLPRDAAALLPAHAFRPHENGFTL